MTNIATLPVFVYGTLRHGHGNWDWALNGRTTGDGTPTPATLQGAVMHSRGGFPYVTPDTDLSNVVHGDLFTITPEHFDAVMSDLDGLEGYREGNHDWSHYLRVIVTVTTADGPVQAWTYIVQDVAMATSLPRIVSGDWNDYARPRYATTG